MGDPFTPDGFEENDSYPAVIVQGSFTSVKEQMPGTYAQKFADQGFVALAFVPVDRQANARCPKAAHWGAESPEPAGR